MMLFSLSPEEVPEKSWDCVSPQERSDYELALLQFHHAGHRNKFNKRFGNYKGDTMGATLHGMMKRKSSKRLVTGGTSFVKARCQTMLK